MTNNTWNTNKKHTRRCNVKKDKKILCKNSDTYQWILKE